MSFFLQEVLSFIIAIPVIIGWVRFKRIYPAFFLVLCMLTLGLCNEILSSFLAHNRYSNAINNNIYFFFASLLVAWQFKYWGLFHKKMPLLFSLIALYLIVLTIESMLLFSPIHFNSYNYATYSFFSVLMSISFINTLIGPEKGSLIKNPAFIICVTLIIFHTFSVLMEIFYIYGLGVSHPDFGINIFFIHTYINLLSNLLYAIAFLWIPRKREFIQL